MKTHQTPIHRFTHRNRSASGHSETVFIVFVSVLVGLLAFVSIAIILDHVRVKEEANIAPTRRIQDLVSLLTQAEANQENLEQEVLQLRERLSALSQGEGAESLLGESLDDDISQTPEYQKLLKHAGLTALTGKGIVVILDDKPDGRSGSERSQSGVNRIQSDDLLKLVNDLRAAGAKAISVNGQRLVSTSAIVNAGPVLMVNQTRIDTPIEIRALGNTKTLHSSLLIRGGILEYLNFFGVQSRILEKRTLQIPAYTLVSF